MCLRLALIVPAIGHIGVDTVMPYQAGPRHAQSIEISLGQIADIEPQPLRRAAVFDNKLQQDETFARITKTRARLKVDVQLVIGFNEPEVAETGRMRQAHAR